MAKHERDVVCDSNFLSPSSLVRKFTQPLLLRLLTMSAFEGTPSLLSADVIYGSPLALLTRARGFRILTYHAERRGGNLGANKSVSCIARSRDRSVTKFQLSSVFLD